MNLIKWKFLNPQKKNPTKNPTKCNTQLFVMHICNCFCKEKNNTPLYVPVDLKALSRVN